jgi:hypothetical protein
MTVPPNSNGSRFGATVSGPSDAPAFIASVIQNLTSNNGNVGSDSFDSGLSQDEDASKLEFQQQDNSGNSVFNFAVARVRLLGKAAATARSVRVFFRLFQAQNSVSDFNENTTYRLASDGLLFGHKIPRLGVQNDQNGSPEYVTVPCFASPRIVLVDPTKSMDDQDDPPNARDLSTNPGVEKDYFFGCWIDNNQPNQLIMPASPPPGNYDGPWQGIQLHSMKDAMTAFPHQCLIAEIRYDDTPIPQGATTSTSDKLAQRNIAWIDGPNPGIPNSRRMVHPVQIRPTPMTAADPDELMITWGNTPKGSMAQLFLPAIDVSNIVSLADRRYSGHQLHEVDAHTIRCTTGGATFIPLPQGTALAAGLLSVDLPASVQRGDLYTINVRQLTDAASVAQQPPPRIVLRDRAASVQTGFTWQRVEGAFQFAIAVSTKEELLLSEERLLAVVRWIQLQTPPTKRWYPVLLRYIEDIAGRVSGFGGNPGSIQPSPTGDVPRLHCPPKAPVGPEEITGKVSGIVYDHFGDFEGFIVETESSHHHRFFTREARMLALVREAWAERVRIRVVSELGREDIPRRLILLDRGTPHAPG